MVDDAVEAVARALALSNDQYEFSLDYWHEKACIAIATHDTVLQDENERLREALQQIAKGEGAFSRDPLEHAESTIDEAKATARAALGESSG